MKKVMWMLFLLVFVWVSTGCGTLMNKKPATVRVSSNPSGASVLLNGNPVGITPTPIVLLNQGEKYTVKVIKSGFHDQIITLDPKLRGKGWGMLVLNVSTVVLSPIATIVAFGTDYGTGSGYKTHKDGDIFINLVPMSTSATVAPSASPPAPLITSQQAPEAPQAPTPIPTPGKGKKEKKEKGKDTKGKGKKEIIEIVL